MARGLHDTVEIEKQAAIKEQGKRDFRDSGLRDKYYEHRGKQPADGAREGVTTTSDFGPGNGASDYGSGSSGYVEGGKRVPRVKRKSAGPDDGVYGSAGKGGMHPVYEERAL